MPVTALTREILSTVVGKGHTDIDFAILLQHEAEGAGHALVAENVKVDDGLGLGYPCPDDVEGVGRIAERRTQWRRATG